MADWDEMAPGFDEAFFKDPMYAMILAAVVKSAAGGRIERALDIGCGTGNLIALLLEESPDARFIGIDPSRGMREVCAERFAGKPNVEIMEGDALSIPYPDGSFDLIVSSLALHHVPTEDKPGMARELARVMERGGRFIHADPFCRVAGDLDDPEKVRDVIELLVAKALYSLDHGAWAMMLGELQSIPHLLRGDGEYITTVGEWEAVLSGAGFRGFEVIDLPPVDLVKVISCKLVA
ncbi:MAG: class I SAM-dependent methyltransferase [Actinomycetota bacterium]